jgi:transcription factor IIIB subunit 2
MVKKNPKYSKRINYDALAGLLGGAGAGRLADRWAAEDEKDDDGELLPLDDKADDDGAFVDEDARDVAPGARARGKARAARAATEDKGEDVPLDEDEEMDVDAEKEDGAEESFADGGWEDAFEQEA